MGTGAWSLTGAGIIVASLAACGTPGATGEPVSPSPAPTLTISPSPIPSPSAPHRFDSIRDALASIASRVDVPVTYPSEGLPADTRLADVHPVSIGRNGPDGPVTAMLDLRFGPRGFLSIRYGSPTFSSGCEEGQDVKEVRVGAYPAILATSSARSDLVWPATFRRPQGSYELMGSFSGREILRLAESMRPVPGLAPATPPPAC
jgi:hypothetical protein